jgi:hypothetical protein
MVSEGKHEKFYQLIPCGRVLLEKLTVSQLVKRFLAFYGSFRRPCCLHLQGAKVP